MDKRKAVAIDLINYYKDKGSRFITIKFRGKEIKNSQTGEIYNAHVLGGGIRWLHENNNIVRVSHTKWEIISYDI